VAPGRASIPFLRAELDGEQSPLRGEDFKPTDADTEGLASFEDAEKFCPAKEPLRALARPESLERQADEHATVQHSPLLPEIISRLGAERAFEGIGEVAHTFSHLSPSRSGSWFSKISLRVGQETAPCVDASCDMKTVSGNPDPKHVSTSFVERQNLTMRMGIRRFTRLTNAFSKKLENHAHMVALHFLYYNFARVHKTLRVTPAMEAGLATHVWTLEEMVSLLDTQK
jgi:hypothetical protein